MANKLIEGDGNLLREAWDRLAPVPGRSLMFSKLIGLMAPYSGTVGARVVELRQDYCRVELRDRRSVRNHLTSVHAIALANLAELTGNVGLAYSLPDDARFIVAGMDMEYLKKARGTIVGITDQAMPRSADRCEYEVVVEMRDRVGDLVARGRLRTLVGPKKR
ncbi:MAG: DUF4442 domain-containing protein [Myxococcales bacterium]|nr:DUF4442 domain-containing protein [Myxococcales bacterium]